MFGDASVAYISLDMTTHHIFRKSSTFNTDQKIEYPNNRFKTVLSTVESLFHFQVLMDNISSSGKT